MKKILAFLLVLTMSLCTFVCPAFAAQAKVMTSFYPIYIFALNIFDGIEDISVECMTTQQVGCLHDYQLVISDMMKLAQSEMFIVCGAGMEPFLHDIEQQFPTLNVVECANAVTLLDELGEHHDHHSHHDHAHEDNGHIWLNVDNALAIVRLICDNAVKNFPEHAEKIHANTENYCNRLVLLKETLDAQLGVFSGKQVISFHSAFSYFFHPYDIEVLATIEHEESANLSPASISMLIRYVNTTSVPPLFAAPDEETAAVYTVSSETGAQVFIMDPITSGKTNLTAYEDAMLSNMQVVADAFN